VEALAASAVAIALAVVLHQLRVRLPHGGSVTAGSVLPVWVVARRFGLRWGVACGAGLGCALLLLGGTAVHPVQAFLDYPLAHSALGLAALTGSPVAGMLIATIARYALHTASGVWYFAAFAPAGWDPLPWAMAYNAFVFPDAAVALALLTAIRRREPALLDGGGSGHGSADDPPRA
jgi:thiamine transporter